MQKILVCLIALMSIGCSGEDDPNAPPPDLAPETLRSVSTGDVMGFISENGSYTWRGIPYAADTSGKNRWRAPRPATIWDGAWAANQFAPACPQIATPFTQIDGWVNGEIEGSEDCLALDIYTPKNAADRDLPVMVWIHGGSNVSGASQIYIGDQLAKNENVIVVSIQYRLGPLGWFSHQALRDSAQTPHDNAANFALLDQVAALQWVHDNISAFGGNPGNVTIFGESAGGHNVAALLASPLARGLFHRAIIQSGGFISTPVADAEREDSKLLNPSAVVTQRLGGIEKFRTASVQEIFNAFETANGFTELPRMIEDGITLPSTPLLDAFRSTDTFNVVPIITGTNKDEMKLFFLFNDRLVKRILGRFIVARDQDLYDAASEYYARNWRVNAVDIPAAIMADAGHNDVYAYRFDWDEGGRFLWMDLAKIIGAAHGIEIPFVFNRFEFSNSADPILFQEKTFETRDALSRSMGAYWASFARNGKPSAHNGPSWPPYSNQETLMAFDSSNDGGVHTITGADSFDAIFTDLSSDKRMEASERCETVDGFSEFTDIDNQTRLNAIRALGCDNN